MGKEPPLRMIHPNLMVNDLNYAIEEAVSFTFKEKKKTTPGNKIPRLIHDLMRRKEATSRQYKSTKCWKNLLELRAELKEIDSKLSVSYAESRDKKEAEAVAKIKDDPAGFYSYAKS